MCRDTRGSVTLPHPSYPCATLEKKVYIQRVNILELKGVLKEKVDILMMRLFCVYIWMMVLLKHKKEEFSVERNIRISFDMLYHTNYLKLSRAVHCFLSLRFYRD